MRQNATDVRGEEVSVTGGPTMSSSRILHVIPSWLSMGYALFVAAFALQETYVALRYHYVFPYADDWRILNDFFSKPLGEFLLAPQNGHRMPVTLFLLNLDYQFFLGRMGLLVAVTVGCVWLSVAAFYVAMRASGEMRSAVSRTSFAFGVFCLFWAASIHDLIWGMNQGTAMAVMLCFASLAAVACYQARRGAPASQWTERLPILAGLAALVATFGQAVGFAMWPALLAIAIVARFPRKAAQWFVLGAILTAAFYLVGREASAYAPIGSYSERLRQRPIALVDSSAAFVGAPVGRAAQGLGLTEGRSKRKPRSWYDPPGRGNTTYSVSRWAGLVGLGGLVAFTLRLLLAPLRAHPRVVFFLGLMFLSSSAAILVSLNRSNLLANLIGVRFITPATIFWIGAACAVFTALGRRKWPVLHILTVVLVWLISIGMLPSLEEARSRQAALRQRLSNWAVMHVLGVQHDPYTRWQPMKQSPEAADVAYRVAARFEQDRRNFFAEDWADLPGERIGERFELSSTERCEGSVASISPIETRNVAAAVISGTASDHVAKTSLVVVTTPGDIIVGLALPGTRDRREKWSGMIANFDESTRYDFYSIAKGDGAACRFASVQGGGPVSP